MLLALSAWFLGKRAAWLAALAGIAVYTLLVGAEPSVLRAALMGVLVVIAAALDRKSTALVSLAAAVLVMAAFSPHVLWDVGFQMSAAATAGLVLVTPRLSSTFSLRRPAQRSHSGGSLHAAGRLLGDSIAVTLGASLAVLPLILFYFQRLSLIGVLTNLLIVPVQPLILFAGSAALLLGLVGLWPVAQLLFWGAWLGLWWTVAVVDATAGVRWASVAIGGYGMAALLASYALLAAFVWQARKAGGSAPAGSRAARALRSPRTLAALALACALPWMAIRALPDGRLHIHVLPVEKGMALLLQTPSGAQVLVDGGGDAAALLTQLGGVMSFWDRSLDLALLSIADKRAATTQASLPARLRVDAATGPPEGDSAADAAVDAWARAMEAEGVPVTRTGAGGWLDLGDGVALWAQATPPTTRGKVRPLTWRLVHGDFSMVLAGGPTPVGEAGDVLLLRTASDAEEGWLATAAPALAVVYGAASLDALTAGQTTSVHYPSTDGLLHIWSDGTDWSWE